MRIEPSDYWMGRDSRYRMECTRAIRENADDLLARVNRLLPFLESAGVAVEDHPGTGSPVSSGWRPATINAGTPGAAVRSRHLTGEAVDLFDPDGEIDAYLWEHQDLLARQDVDLYMEHPAATKGWCHLQTPPPPSQARKPLSDRRRWFYP